MRSLGVVYNRIQELGAKAGSVELLPFRSKIISVSGSGVENM
jgi:hypothetical protein